MLGGVPIPAVEPVRGGLVSQRPLPPLPPRTRTGTAQAQVAIDPPPVDAPARLEPDWAATAATASSSGPPRRVIPQLPPRPETYTKAPAPAVAPPTRVRRSVPAVIGVAVVLAVGAAAVLGFSHGSTQQAAATYIPTPTVQATVVRTVIASPTASKATASHSATQKPSRSGTKAPTPATVVTVTNTISSAPLTHTQSSSHSASTKPTAKSSAPRKATPTKVKSNAMITETVTRTMTCDQPAGVQISVTAYGKLAPGNATPLTITITPPSGTRISSTADQVSASSTTTGTWQSVFTYRHPESDPVGASISFSVAPNACSHA